MGRPSPLWHSVAVCAGFIALTTAGMSGQAARADYSSWGVSTQEKQIYDYGAGGSNARPRSATVMIVKNDGGRVGT